MDSDMGNDIEDEIGIQLFATCYFVMIFALAFIISGSSNGGRVWKANSLYLRIPILYDFPFGFITSEMKSIG